MKNQTTNNVDETTGEIPKHFSRFRTAYDHGNIRVPVIFKNPSRTKQEFKEQCDVNRIVENFTRTGQLTNYQEAQAKFLDLASLPVSYHDALNLVLSARDAFAELPAAARAEYGNDVNIFLQEAYHNPDEVFKPRPAPLDTGNPSLSTTPPLAPVQGTPASPEPQTAPLTPPAS